MSPEPPGAVKPAAFPASPAALPFLRKPRLHPAFTGFVTQKKTCVNAFNVMGKKELVFLFVRLTGCAVMSYKCSKRLNQSGLQETKSVKMSGNGNC
jgi:hypothetical protein